MSNKKHIWFSPRGFANEGQFISYRPEDQAFVHDLVASQEANCDSVLNLDAKAHGGYGQIMTIREYYDDIYHHLPERFWPECMQAALLTAKG